jgi:hypothetical protein
MEDLFIIRSWRNRNPGNLRPVKMPDIWQGQCALDYAEGGPFSVFKTPAFGFRALAILLRTYEQRYGLVTIQAIIERYAPAAENSTGAYIDAVCKRLSIARSTRITGRDSVFSAALYRIIAHIEAGQDLPWQADDISWAWQQAWLS